MAASITCPYIHSLGIASVLNVESNTTESVTINNIDTTLTYSANVAAAFDCSGWGLDEELAQTEVLIENLVVSLPSSGAALKTVLANAVGGDDDNAANAATNKLNNYLRGQFTAAFETAFPAYEAADFPNSVVDSARADAVGAGGASVPGTTAQVIGAGAATTGAADTANATGASIVLQTSTISSYAFHLDVSGAAAASAMVDALTVAHLNSLFMQLPLDNLKYFADASGNPTVGGAEGAAEYRGLPLKEGDKITFVFDVEVAATSDTNISNAGANAGGAGNATGAPPGSQGVPPTSQQSINMDLGTRRVAFEITQAAA
jgi:hypothetical protein